MTTPQILPLPGRMSRRMHLIAVGGLWLLTALAYSNSLRTGLVYDNAALIAKDTRIHQITARNLRLIIGESFWYGNGPSNLYRPLTTLSFLFNYAILGNRTNPIGYHLTNLAIHTVNVTLVYLLARWILEETTSAWLLTAIWAVHPVLTESVTNIVGRASMLAAFAILAGLICHIRAYQTGQTRRQFWLAGLMAASAAGIFSKESAIALVGILILYDLTLGPYAPLRMRIENYATAIFPQMIFLYLRLRILPSLPITVPFTDNPIAYADFWTGRLTAVKVLGECLRLLWWPVRLSADYSYNQIPLYTWQLRTLEDWKAPIATATCLAILAIGVASWRRRPRLSFFIGIFFITLAPVCNVFVVTGTIMAERSLYLPAIATAGCLVEGVRAFQRRFPFEWPPRFLTGHIALLAVCLAFAVRTYARNPDWTNDITLMASTAEASPNSFRPHQLLALVNDPRLSIAEANRTLEILDGLPDERNVATPYRSAAIAFRHEGERMASLKSQVGADVEAKRWFLRSLDALVRARGIDETLAGLHHQERQRHGIEDYASGWYPVYVELGRTYLRLGRPEEALHALQYGATFATHPDIYAEMANAYRDLGNPREAAVALWIGHLLNANDADLMSRLAALYREIAPACYASRPDGAEPSINLECPPIRDHYCAAKRKVAALRQKTPTTAPKNLDQSHQ